MLIIIGHGKESKASNVKVGVHQGSVRIDVGLGVEPPTSTFKTHYFS